MSASNAQLHQDNSVGVISSAVDALQLSGFAELPCDVKALTRLSEVFAALPLDRMFDAPAGEVFNVMVSDGRFASLVVAPTAVTSRMRWFWASDEATLRLFDPAASHCWSTLENVAKHPVMLYAACFVVVRGPCLDPADVRDHEDWGHPKIPVGSSFTSLAPLAPFPASVGGLHIWPWDSNDREYRYRFGHHGVIDGKLFHQTEPFRYRRGCNHVQEVEACNAYEGGGHVRVLVSLSIASTEDRLALYNQKVLRAMVPRPAYIRNNPGMFIDSGTEYATSDSGDSECSNEASDQDSASDNTESEADRIHTVLQGGTWCGSRHSSSEWDHSAESFSVDLVFDHQRSVVLIHGQTAGGVSRALGTWRANIRLEQAGLVLSGEFVRSAASVCLQGKFTDSGGGGFFCLFPPRAWHVPLKLWRRFRLPHRTIGLPPEPDVVELRWGERPSSSIVAIGRAARWNAHCPFVLGSAEGKWLPLGKAVLFADDDMCASLQSLEKGCVIMVPDSVQRRQAFEDLLGAASAADCSAIVILQGNIPGLPRAARARASGTAAVAETPQVVLLPGFTVTTCSLNCAAADLVGESMSVRAALPTL
eukprot:TRINITY_DN25094_c0_g1_i1.p1 TRINITY_DN25094_c0_g1~~TRINITY_DN25094_c0_g1_i1.p1  ORF type:complete len:591 (-),score=62.19 TRINITY_DN25094_c0_g1_i1:19-1791(-)